MSRSLDLGVLPPSQRRARHERHLLALSGGGYRGLFTAEVLAAAEAENGRRLKDCFDALAGTSVGGILAIGLACSVPAQNLSAMIVEHGSEIFRPRPMTFAGWTSSRYSNDGLRLAIEKVLTKPVAQRSFAEIEAHLTVTAVNEGTGIPRLFQTDAAANGQGDDVSTLDVALATSAAPTYFPPYRIEGSAYVDGGLVANAPDLIVLSEAMRTFGCSLDECRLLSVGTAGAPRSGRIDGQPGKFGWLAKHAIIDLIMTSQENLAVEVVSRLRPGTFLRVDRTPPTPIRLDDTSEGTMRTLRELAREAVAKVERDHRTDWRRFLAHRT